MAETEITPNIPGRNTGHGWVWPLADGAKARCGGPAICAQCKADEAEFAKPAPVSLPPEAYALPTENLADLEVKAIEQAAAKCNGNRHHMAKLLGISVRTVQRKIKFYGLPVLPVSVPSGLSLRGAVFEDLGDLHERIRKAAESGREPLLKEATNDGR